jgi:hypothetical protein
MTESRRPRRIPVGHVISRVLLGSLVVLLVAAAAVLAVLHGASELTVGRIVWGSVKNWALPW